MNKFIYWAVFLGLGLASFQIVAKEAPGLKTDKDKVSYGIGVDIGKNFKRLGLDVDLDVLTQGLKDAYAGKKLSLSEEELRTILNAYQSELMQKQAATLKAQGEANQKAGESFLAQNAKKDGFEMELLDIPTQDTKPAESKPAKP